MVIYWKYMMYERYPLVMAVTVCELEAMALFLFVDLALKCGDVQWLC